MSRWRDRPPPSSPYITAEGYGKLEQESRELWNKRNEVRQALSAAAAEGDRSENAEYIYRKKQLREIDNRIAWLQKRLPKLKIIKRADSTEVVYFSARVELELDDGSLVSYRIVGADEFDQHESWISIDSPLARALLGKRVDDEVTINTRDSEVTYTIVSIKYQ